MKNILLVINPKAGKGVPSDFEDRVISYCDAEGVNCKIYRTKGKDDSQQIDKLLDDNDFDAIFPAGGDGTFNLIAECVNGLAVKVGIIPMGTSNGLASDLEIDSDPFCAFQNLVKSSRVLKLDQIVVNNQKSLYHIGDIGANASLIKRYESNNDSGYAAYTKHIFEELRSEEAFSYDIETPKGSYSGKARMIAICNARRFGTKVALNQKSHPADGVFELIIFNEIDLKTLMETGLSSIWEGFDNLTSEKKEVIQTTSAHIKISPKTLYQLDGEVQGETKELKLELRKGVIELLCQDNCPYI